MGDEQREHLGTGKGTTLTGLGGGWRGGEGRRGTEGEWRGCGGRTPGEMPDVGDGGGVGLYTCIPEPKGQ